MTSTERGWLLKLTDNSQGRDGRSAHAHARTKYNYPRYVCTEFR